MVRQWVNVRFLERIWNRSLLEGGELEDQSWYVYVDDFKKIGCKTGGLWLETDADGKYFWGKLSLDVGSGARDNDES